MAAIKKIYNENGIEIGSILTSILISTSNNQEKIEIENILKQYAIDKLYPHTGVNVYSEFSKDIASIIVIKNINSLTEYNSDLPL